MTRINAFIDSCKIKWNNTRFMRFYNKKLKSTFLVLSSIVSWSVFLILIMASTFLMYYFFTLKIYQVKGAGYEPPFTLYTIISPSMEPNIKVYDVVVSKKVNKDTDIKEGDVISFISSDFQQGRSITVTHRVIEILKRDSSFLYTTKGDNNLIKDPTPVYFDAVVGKVNFKIPQLGRVQFFLASSIGWILIVIIPAVIIILKEIFKLLNLIEVSKRALSKLKRLPLFNKQLYLPYKGKREEVKEFNKNNYLNNEIKKKKHKNKNEKKTELNLGEVYKDARNIINKKHK